MCGFLPQLCFSRMICLYHPFFSVCFVDLLLSNYLHNETSIMGCLTGQTFLVKFIYKKKKKKKQKQNKKSCSPPLFLPLLSVKGPQKDALFTSIKDPCGVCHLLGDIIDQPFSQSCMHFLGLIRGGGLACSDSPHRLVGNHHTAPVCHIGCKDKKNMC